MGANSKRMRPELLALCLAVLAGSTQASLVGETVPPYPAGTEVLFGACIAGNAGYEALCNYSFQTLHSDQGTALSILVLEAVEKSSNGEPLWRALNEIPYPQLPAKHELSISGCRVDGDPQETVMAVVEVTDEEWLQANGWAIEVDLSSGAFTAIEPATVDCINEAYGL